MSPPFNKHHGASCLLLLCLMCSSGTQARNDLGGMAHATDSYSHSRTILQLVDRGSVCTTYKCLDGLICTSMYSTDGQERCRTLTWLTKNAELVGLFDAGTVCNGTWQCSGDLTCTSKYSADGQYRCRSDTWLAKQAAATTDTTTASPSPSPAPVALLTGGSECNTTSQCVSPLTCTSLYSTDGKKRCRTQTWLDTQAAAVASPSPSPSPSPVPVASPSPSPAPVPTIDSAYVTTKGVFAKDDFKQALQMSWLFYEAQRSGSLPTNNRVAWRRSAHTSDQVPGGWYDAGDYLKLNFPLASTVSFLAWGIVEFEDAYRATGQLDHALRNLKAASDYLMNCHIASRKYIGQIGHPDIDHDFWGRPEEQSGKRPAYIYDSSTPAPDLYGKVAAALASTSVAFKSSNPTYASELLTHAKDMYQWGVEAKSGLYSKYYTSATASIYPSTDFEDEMMWGAAWLYMATKDRYYLTEAERYWKLAGRRFDVTLDWDNSGPAAVVLLASLVEDGVSVPSGSEYKSYTTDRFIKAWVQSNGFEDIVKTAKGLSRPNWASWGTIPMATNGALAALSYAKHTKSATVRSSAVQWARSQVEYALGSAGRSYVVGFGDKYPLYPHHAGASCPDRPAACDWDDFSSTKPNPQILYGALVAGPSKTDTDYHDKRDDYITNEVANDYNSGFTGALAGLYQLTA